uniref:Uncharacterized protein n=1 Tax=Pipistrellus kuhlii TaxID=59472 RepID=A0A7J7UTR7_PIPKU|nr:hypothetical protein mPipKuh1_008685 [Pipistrellus kuhlii]
MAGVPAVLGSGIGELSVQATRAAEEQERENPPQYKRLREPLARAQSWQQGEQRDHLQKDVGSVAWDTGTAMDCFSPVWDPLTQRTSGEEGEEADSDTDGMDHRAAEGNHEEPASQDFMQESMALTREL